MSLENQQKFEKQNAFAVCSLLRSISEFNTFVSCLVSSNYYAYNLHAIFDTQITENSVKWNQLVNAKNAIALTNFHVEELLIETVSIVFLKSKYYS